MQYLADKSVLDRFFDEHLPYRLRLLLRHCNNVSASPVAECEVEFIASVITGRLLLGFLGVKKSKQEIVAFPGKGARGPGEDILAVHLGGKSINLSSLTEIRKNQLFRYLDMADKAVAHLTFEKHHEYELAREIGLEIYELMNDHLYLPTGRPRPTFEELHLEVLSVNSRLREELP